MTRRIMAIDATNILMRSYWAAAVKQEDDQLHDEQGRVTTHLFFFVNSIIRHLRVNGVTHGVACWDSGRSFRSDLYPDYKASRGGRPSTADEAGWLKVHAMEFTEALGLANHAEEGFEADDLIAAQRLRLRDDEELVILSSDKDLLQLVDGQNVWQIRPGSDPEVWGEVTVYEKFGVRGRQLPILMGMAGDSGDGVKGVHRIGMKTARKIVEELGSADYRAVLSHPKVAVAQKDFEDSFAVVDLWQPRDIARMDPTPVALQSDDLRAWLEGAGFDSIVQSIRGS